MKGIIINGVFYVAPEKIIANGVTYYPNSTYYYSLGYREVVDVEYEVSPYCDYSPVYAYAEDMSVIHKTMQPTLKPLEELKEIRVAEAEVYYQSAEVKEFTYNDIPMWWDDELRSKLTTKANYSSGEVGVWYDGLMYTMERSTLVAMLESVELYSASCYSNLQELKLSIAACTESENLLETDITSGYPKKLEL